MSSHWDKSREKPNKNQLGLIAACILGDGCLYRGGRLIIAHGLKQRDYLDWKVEKLNFLLNSNLKALPTRQCVQYQYQRKYLKDFYDIWYLNKKKNISQLLEYITNPLEAIAIWVCDDGNVCPSIAKNGKLYSASIQIFTFTELEESQRIADWFEKTIGIRPNLLFRDRSKTGRKSAYILKFTAHNSRELYKKIKPFIPEVESMKYKFRHIEYNLSTRSRRENLEKII